MVVAFLFPSPLEVTWVINIVPNNIKNEKS